MKRYYCLFKTFKNWPLYLAYKYGLVNLKTLIFKTRNGVIVEVPIRLLHVFKEIFMEECYMAGMKCDIPPNSTIIDIGANAGYFTLFAASAFSQAKLFSFEPVPVNYAQLKRHQDLNDTCKISCYPLAVAGHSGEINLNFDTTDSFTTAATIFASKENKKESLSFPCITLKEIMDENAIEKCNLLKMDCEGAEYDILYNCPPEYLQRIDQIAMEFHRGGQKNQNVEALETFFRKQGFMTRRKRGKLGMLWAWRDR
jgi:FkbM family methyltransferase